MTDTTEQPAKQGMNPHTLRHAIWQLTLDWILLRREMPKPAHNNAGRRATTREYGHPAEWASDKAAHITAILTSWHEYLADHRGEPTPAPHQSEQAKVVAAWKYLQCRVDELAGLVDAADLKELPDLHHSIRRALGYSNPPQALPMPCPNPNCELRGTLQRHNRVGSDFIQCEHCGWTADESHYPLLIRITLDTLIANS
jgi:hypothetical protein